jgi:hypothetical protein
MWRWTALGYGLAAGGALAFDISFHPVPWALLTEVVHPWILGERPASDLDPWVRDAVRLARVRARAKAWAFAVEQLDDAPASFDPQLHLYGRPFLVAVRGAPAIAEVVDRYLAATPDEVDDLAREQLELLQPGLSDRVSPATTGSVPSDGELAKSARAWMDLMRASVAAALAGETSIAGVDGRPHDPKALLQRDLFFTVLEFCAIFQPGWMSRGMLWPTHLLAQAEVGTADLFIANSGLVMPVYRRFESLPWAHADTIYENYMVGGCASPKQIPMVREALEAHVRPTDPWGRSNIVKLDEALSDALYRNLPFAEATEIYSATAGNLN